VSLVNIYLIGYRCSGKTTVGKSLAETLGWFFIDLDSEFVRQIRTPISEFVAQHGWDRFREKEHHILKRICAKTRHVVATGGGVVTDHRNTQIMQGSGTIVWLKASIASIKQRILNDHTTDTLRPALTSDGTVNEIDELLAERTPLYATAADLSIETDNYDVIKISDRIAKQLEESQGLAFIKSMK